MAIKPTAAALWLILALSLAVGVGAGYLSALSDWSLSLVYIWIVIWIDQAIKQMRVDIENADDYDVKELDRGIGILRRFVYLPAITTLIPYYLIRFAIEPR